MAELYHDIFDRVFKKTISLSSKAVIRMINSMFEKNYPTDSIVTYNWTELVKDDLRKILADTIITINEEDRYHFEAQMADDKSIIFRMMDYGFMNARQMWERNQNMESDYSNVKLSFPKQRIIYLYHENPIPEEMKVSIEFEDQGEFVYRIKTVDFLNESIEEINNKNMIILIPFALLKLRKAFYEVRSEENIAALKTLFWDDIMGSIDRNKELENITEIDASMLKGLCIKLFQHIYSEFEESEEVCSVRDQSIILEIEPYIDKMEDAIAKMEAAEEKTKAAEEKIKATEARAEAAEEKIKATEARAEAAEEKTKAAETRAEAAEAEVALLRKKLEALETK